MGYVPDFENDIFISYAHIDNQPLTERQKGWIDNFHRSLEVRLAQLLGADAKIWRDAKLQGNDYFSDTLVKQFPKIAVMISVLSPRYIKSEWCLKEVHEFYTAAEQSGGVRIADKARIFKVVKTHIPRENHPEELQGVLGYEFYQIDSATGRPREFVQDIGPEADRNYLDKFEDLAQDIYQLLEIIKNRKAGSSPIAPAGVAVYLAETTFDRSLERDQIKRDLQQRGYAILPDKPLPLNVSDFQNGVRAYLQRCKLSLHLIGESYGIIPEGDTRSIAYLQHELAAERSQDPAFSRLIWLPVGVKAKEDRQQDFIHTLQNGIATSKGTELLQTTLEELKTVILDKLTASSKPAAEPVKEEGPVRVYLICDSQDFEATKPLEDYLYDQGFEVILPAAEGEETAVREYHKEQLLLSDAILIYQGSASDIWLRTKLLDLQKIYGYGRSKPMLAKAIYVGAPETAPKQRFRTREALVIKNFGGFSPETLKPFLTDIENGKGGRR